MNCCSKKIKKGFTLVEVLITIALIAILSSITLTIVLAGMDKAKIGRAKGEIKQIYDTIMELEVDTGCWPKALADIACKTPYVVESGANNNEIWDLGDNSVGLTGDSGGVFPKWGGPYIEKVFKDPWGNDYFFDTDYDIDPDVGVEKMAVVICSFGPNGVGPNIYDEDNVIFVIVSE